MPTRRQFLVGCSAVAASTSVFPQTVLARAGAGNLSLDEISFSAFTRRVRTDFLAYVSGNRGVQLRLLEAQAKPVNYRELSRTDYASNEQFTLLFSGPLREQLEQGTYLFQHGSLGRFEMFIVPVGRSDSYWMYYEAVFNRPNPALMDFSRGRTLRQAVH